MDGSFLASFCAERIIRGLALFGAVILVAGTLAGLAIGHWWL